jgi:hypothetical protein
MFSNTCTQVSLPSARTLYQSCLPGVVCAFTRSSCPDLPLTLLLGVRQLAYSSLPHPPLQYIRHSQLICLPSVWLRRDGIPDQTSGVVYVVVLVHRDPFAPVPRYLATAAS